MERGGIDPIILMASKVGEEREALEREVVRRVETQQEDIGGVTQVAEGDAAAVVEAEEAPKGVVLGRVPTEEVQVSTSRVQELIDQGKSKEEAQRITATEAAGEATQQVKESQPQTQREKLQARIDNLKKQEDEAAVAGDAWDLYERLGKEREKLEAQLQSLDAQEEKGLPEAEQKALTEAEELSREKLVSQLHALADALKEGKLSSEQEQLLQKVFNLETGKAGERKAEKVSEPHVEVVKTGEGKLSYEDRVLRDRTAELLGKDSQELLADLSQLASGELSLEEFAGEVYGEDWKKSKKLQKRFIGRFKDHLKRYGYSKDELDKAGSKELQSMFNRTIEDVLKDEKNSAARKARASYFWLNFFQYLYEDLKGIVVKQAQEAIAQ